MRKWYLEYHEEIIGTFGRFTDLLDALRLDRQLMCAFVVFPTGIKLSADLVLRTF